MRSTPLGTYTRDVLRHWFLLAGGAVTGVIGFVAAAADVTVPSFVSWLLALWFFSIAQFMAYKDVLRRATDEVTKRNTMEERQRRLRYDAVITDETFHPIETLDPTTDRPIVEFRTFRNCTIQGPAVVGMLRTALTDCRFQWDNIEESYYMRTGVVVGSVGFAGCRFERCVFDARIAYVGDADMLAALEQLPRV